MHNASHLPRRVEVIEHAWIPMSDGCRLSARLWLPEHAQAHPVPAVLEYIPYRKSDATAVRDSTIHPYLAGHGYASVRVDMRGSGDSEGVMLDEYLPIEQQDCDQVIAWLAAQPWCTGKVAMIGISWGGVAALQAAVRNPPALATIVPVCASVDRYYDDGGYYVGGLAGQTVGWGAIMLGFNSRPPDPQVVGEQWKALWLQRLEAPLFVQTWLEHQRRDALWIQGSPCEHYDKFNCPVYAVTGWADCWPNTVLRLFEHLPPGVPRRGLIGPWGHTYPHLGFPGPDAGFLQQVVRWFDRWLKGVDNGVDAEPEFCAYLMQQVPATPDHAERPGRWIAEAHWPFSSVVRERRYFNAGRLDETLPLAGAFAIRSPQSCGLGSGEYMPWYTTAEKSAQLPLDQREDDGKSVCFDTPPLTEPLELLGTPSVALGVTVDQPVALVAARLCDVAPDGASTLVSFGILNLARRVSRERPSPLTPGERYNVSVRLNDTGYRFVPGHRLRLALSSSYWPMAWPVPGEPTVTVNAADSYLELPVRLGNAEMARPPALGEAEGAPPLPVETLTRGRNVRTITRDIETGGVTLEIIKDAGRVRLPHNRMEIESVTNERFSIRDDDPLSANADYTCEYAIGRADWQTRTRGRLRMSSTGEHFIVEAQLEAFQSDVRLFDKTWNLKIPRDGF